MVARCGQRSEDGFLEYKYANNVIKLKRTSLREGGKRDCCSTVGLQLFNEWVRRRKEETGRSKKALLSINNMKIIFSAEGLLTPGQVGRGFWAANRISN